MSTSELTRLACLDDYVSIVAWSTDGRDLVAASLAGDVAAWIDDQPVVLPGHNGGTLHAAWSPKQRSLATGGLDGTVRVWSHDAPEVEPVAVGGWVNQVAWHPGGARIAAGAGRDLVVISAQGEVLERHSHPSTVTSVAWTSSGRRVAAGSYGGVWWYQPETDGVYKHFAWKGSILTLAVSPNTKWIASGNQDNSVHVWRLWSGDDMQMAGYEAKVEHLAWDRTSRWLCVGGIGEVTCWDFTGRGPQGTRPKTLKGHDRRITALAFSGSTLASASADGTVRLWTPPKPKPLAVIDVEDDITTMAWNPKGSSIAIGTSSGAVLVAAVQR